MTPADADSYFGTVPRTAPVNTRLGRSQALRTYFEFIELRHQVKIHAVTGVVAQFGTWCRLSSGTILGVFVIMSLAQLGPGTPEVGGPGV